MLLLKQRNLCNPAVDRSFGYKVPSLVKKLTIDLGCSENKNQLALSVDPDIDQVPEQGCIFKNISEAQVVFKEV